MKVNTVAVTIALVLASSVDADIMVRRRPHRDIAAQRRNLDILQGFEDGVSSFMNSFHHNSDGSSSSTSSPTGHALASSPTQSSSEASSSGSSNSLHFDWFGGLLGGNNNDNGRSDVSSGSWPFGPSSKNPLANKPKLGLAWPNGDSMNITNFIKSKVSWYYTWSPTPGMSNPPSDITFCPMLWGFKHLSSFREHVLNNPNANQNSGKCVLAMNEVNQKGQADMSVGDACGLMRDNIVPLKKDHSFYIVSPSTTSAPSGKKWMQNFRQQCSDVWDNIDAVAVHYYDTNVTAFQEYVRDWHDTFNKPIWVTEYACQNFNGGAQCSDVDTFVFQKAMSMWFDQQDFVEAYAPFGVMQQMQGVNANNQLTNNGEPNILFNAIASK